MPKIGKRRRKVKYIDGEGKEYDLDAITIDLGKGSLEDLLGTALDADEDDRVIKRKAVEIGNFIHRTSGSRATLKKRYEMGKILQFVDDLNLKDEDSKREAFLRLFVDLRVDIKRNPSVEKVARYPHHMYTLSKIPEELVFYKGMTWARWFDILEYKSVWTNYEILKEVVKKCCDNNWNEGRLREELQTINRALKGKSNREQ